jgi:hypothetical protein
MPQTGAQTRRAILRAGVCLLGTGAALGAGVATAQAQTPAPAAGTKLAQSAVMYQTHPNNGQLCSICVNFQAPNACAIVEGKINPVGWCVAFAPKA